MRTIAFIATALLLMVSCTQQADTGAAEKDELAKQNIEVVKKFLTALEEENVDAAMELLSEECINHGPILGKYDTLSREDLQAWVNNVDSLDYGVVKIMHESIKEGDLAGDWVLLWCHNSWYSVKAEKKIELMSHTPMRIEDGKIAYMASYWNQWDLYQQLGAELKWPEKKKEE